MGRISMLRSRIVATCAVALAIASLLVACGEQTTAPVPPTLVASPKRSLQAPSFSLMTYAQALRMTPNRVGSGLRT